MISLSRISMLNQTLRWWWCRHEKITVHHFEPFALTISQQIINPRWTTTTYYSHWESLIAYQHIIKSIKLSEASLSVILTESLRISPFLNSLQCREASKHKVACWSSTLSGILRQQGENLLDGFETTLCRACKMGTRAMGAASIWETTVSSVPQFHAYIHYTYVCTYVHRRAIPNSNGNNKIPLYIYFLWTKNRTLSYAKHQTSHHRIEPTHLQIHTRKLDLRFEPWTKQTNACVPICHGFSLNRDWSYTRRIQWGGHVWPWPLELKTCWWPSTVRSTQQSIRKTSTKFPKIATTKFQNLPHLSREMAYQKYSLKSS